MPPLPRSVSLLRAFGLAVCVFPLIPACGGRSDTEDYLYGSPTAATGANGSGASSATGASSGTNNPGDGDMGDGDNGNGANGTGANGTGATSALGGEGSDPGGGGTSSTGGTGTGSAGSTSQAGSAGAPSGPRISCGDTTCDSSKQVCCAGLGGIGCVGKNDECNGTTLRCSSTDDCNGNTVCCLKVIDDLNSGSMCKSACLGMGPSRERQLCVSDDECPFGHCRATVFGVSVCTRR